MSDLFSQQDDEPTAEPVQEARSNKAAKTKRAGKRTEGSKAPPAAPEATLPVAETSLPVAEAPAETPVEAAEVVEAPVPDVELAPVDEEPAVVETSSVAEEPALIDAPTVVEAAPVVEAPVVEASVDAEPLLFVPDPVLVTDVPTAVDAPTLDMPLEEAPAEKAPVEKTLAEEPAVVAAPEVVSTPVAEASPVVRAAPVAERMPTLLSNFRSDRDCLERTFAVPFSPRRFARMRTFLTEWTRTIEALPFAELSPSDRVDWLLFHSLLETEIRRLGNDESRFAAVEVLLPFASDLIVLEERRRAFQDVEPRAAAELLDATRLQIESLREGLTSAMGTVDANLAGRAARTAGQLRGMLETWYGFYHGYDPVFDWWTETPYPALNSALDEYAKFLRETVAGVVGEAILGEPIGQDALKRELGYAQVAYTPEELIAAAEVEMEWCREELRRAAKEMGLGDDWRAAMDRVKSEHVEPGKQPALVRDLAYEAIEYVEAHDLVTVPPVARECWRMEMMSAERQKMSPFFLGGETIIVSFPTREMEQARKRMSLRGNNRAFARATVHHELIPGHHLQLFSMERYRPYRQLFRTPFWIEGWTLHWEMLLWEREFAGTPEERVGMLFWRMHRAARVIFSLKFHLGEMTAAECVEMLVQEACHEWDNALAEVRRSFEGDYPPLYQCAYLVGAWQMHALYRELVGSKKMTDREFHDAVLQENCMPIPTLRAVLTGQALTQDFSADWRFHPLPSPEGV